MGCSFCKHKKEFYTDVENEQEFFLRQWEENIGGHSRTFTNLLRNIRFNLYHTNYGKTEKIFKENFNEEMQKLIQLPYFKEKEGYDAKKIEKLIFLLARPEKLSSPKYSYYDKAAFIFGEIKNPENDLHYPIEKTSENLKKFIRGLIKVTLKGISSGYLKIHELTNQESILKEMIDNEDNITKLVFEDVFNMENEDSCTITFWELSNRFRDDTWFFTSGYFREFGFEALKKETIKAGMK